MAAARNVSAAARMTLRPAAGVAGGELADRRRLAGAVDADDEHDRGPALDRGAGLPVDVAIDQQGGQLGADRRLRPARLASLPGALDEIDRQRGADVTGDERLLDLVPLRAVGVPEVATELGHQAGAGLLEAGLERTFRDDGEERGRVERRVRGRRRRLGGASNVGGSAGVATGGSTAAPPGASPSDRFDFEGFGWRAGRAGAARVRYGAAPPAAHPAAPRGGSVRW